MCASQPRGRTVTIICKKRGAVCHTSLLEVLRKPLHKDIVTPPRAINTEAHYAILYANEISQVSRTRQSITLLLFPKKTNPHQARLGGKGTTFPRHCQVFPPKVLRNSKNLSNHYSLMNSKNCHIPVAGWWQFFLLVHFNIIAHRLGCFANLTPFQSPCEVSFLYIFNRCLLDHDLY